ncbi:mismatched base pair and cruciform DNA recognition protein [Histoplasma ohiense]|nr:mismatched base pair and cruciform DNA recognition protein [Histoplasma ohiense (nom. inval.)]
MSSSTNESQPQEATSSYLEQASNAVKNTVNKMTGTNTSDDKESKDDSQPSGQYNQTIGSAKQAAGAAIGNEDLRKAGERQNAEGEQQEAHKQAQKWGEGAGDRVKGKVGEFFSGPGFGGSEQERMDAEAERRKYTQMHEEGKSQQKVAEQDIQNRWGDDDKSEEKK